MSKPRVTHLDSKVYADSNGNPKTKNYMNGSSKHNAIRAHTKKFKPQMLEEREMKKMLRIERACN